MGLRTFACTLSCLSLWSSEQCLPLSHFLLALVLLLLLPTPMWMPNRHHRPMKERVELSLPSRGLLACARGGINRLSILVVLACLLYVFDL